MTVTDFHSHILPAMDHGCADVHQAVSQLKLIKASGTDIAVATPHFYPHIHKVGTFIAKSDIAVSQLKAAKPGDAPRLAIGAEVLLCENLHVMKDLRQLCVRGTNVILLELPLEHLRDGHYDAVDYMLSNGYTVLLAHIDRYLRDHGNGVDELLSMGALAQINASCLSSHFILKKIRQYLEYDRGICALGSDLHGTDEKLYHKFVKSKKLLGEYFDKIMSHSSSLLSGAELIDLT